MEIVAAIIGSGALSALISGCFSLLMARQKKDTGVRAGVRIILYDRIKYLALRYISEGEVSAEALEDLIEMHRIYHNEMDGNGFLDKAMSDVKKVPIKK